MKMNFTLRFVFVRTCLAAALLITAWLLPAVVFASGYLSGHPNQAMFDVAWKANLRNVALIERHIGDPVLH